MKSSRLSFVVATAVALVTLGAAPVGAEPVPGAPAAVLFAAGGGGCSNRTNSDCEILHLEVDLFKSETPAGTTVLLQLRGCEGDEDVKTLFPEGGPFPNVGTPFTIGDTAPSSDDGGLYELPYSLFTSYPGEAFHLGPSWSGTLTVTRPGMEPWVQQFTHATPSGDSTLGRYTDKLVCPRDDPDASALVDTWSKFKGKPIVGRRVSITPTTLTPVGQSVGAKASYAWLVNKRVVSRRLSTRLKKSYAGKVLSIRITVTAPGKKTLVEGGPLGKVRPRR